MSFRCPQCLTVDSLEITHSIELPPDRRYEELALQVVNCRVCSFRGLAVYEEARGSTSTREDWGHTGYRVSPDAVASVLEAIQACPNPHDPNCRCAAHTSLGEKDLHGMWCGLLELDRVRPFSMRMYMG